MVKEASERTSLGRLTIQEEPFLMAEATELELPLATSRSTTS